jgi:uncharacterized protein YidB (DUF937 family)
MLGQIIGGLMGGGQQGAQPSAIAGILQQIMMGGGAGGSGGIGALVSRFEAVGLGQHAQSWVSTGPNLPVSPDQLSTIFSREEIQGWAQQAGTNPETMLKILSEALPRAVDHVTPEGQVPAQNANIGGMLANLLGSQGGRPPA